MNKAAGLNILTESKSMKVEKYILYELWIEKIQNLSSYKEQSIKKSPEKDVLNF